MSPEVRSLTFIIESSDGQYYALTDVQEKLSPLSMTLLSELLSAPWSGPNWPISGPRTDSLRELLGST